MMESVDVQLEGIAEACSKENWNSYGASPIPPTALRYAARVAEVIRTHTPWMVPTVNGGIQLEWHVDEINIEIALGPNGLQEGDE